MQLEKLFNTLANCKNLKHVEDFEMFTKCNYAKYCNDIQYSTPNVKTVSKPFKTVKRCFNRINTNENMTQVYPARTITYL